jgi:hypothetical protein
MHRDALGADLRAALDRQEQAYRHARATVFDPLGSTPVADGALTEEQSGALEALERSEQEVQAVRAAWRSGSRADQAASAAHGGDAGSAGQ